jgi:predicted permease
MNPAFGLRLCRLLLRFFPAAFRDEYEEEMLSTVVGRHGAMLRQSGASVVGFWTRECIALLRAAWRVRARQPRRRRRSTENQQKKEWNMGLLLRDVRIALRSLRRAPTFTIVAVVTLALGIGANTAIFSVVHNVLLTPLDFENPREVVAVWGEDLNYSQLPVATGDFQDIREQSTTITDFSARYSIPTSLTGDDGEPEEVTVVWATANYFSLIGITPALGRGYTEEEEDAVVLSHGLWRRRYGSDPNVLGKRILIGGRPHVVVGVLPAGVNPNVTMLRSVRETNDIWRLMRPRWLEDDDRINAWLRIVGRLKPEATVEQAQAEMNTIAQRILEVAQDNAHVGFRLHVVSIHDDIVRRARPLLLVLMGAVTFVLLIACFNVANLLLVRAQGRSQEMAVRSALGGGRGQLARQLLVESTLLGLLGGAAGVGLASAGISLLRAVRPANLPRLDTVSLDGSVLIFALAGSLIAAVLFGLVPAVRASRADLMTSLTDRGTSHDRGHQRISRALIVSEVALSLVLLIGTGLLLRSFVELRKIRPGFDTEHILTVSLSESGRAEDGEQARLFFTQFEEEVSALPGVEAVGYANRIPLGGGLYGGPWATEETQARGDTEEEGAFRFVSAGYFQAMGTRLLAGRFFNANEDWEVAIVDEKTAAMAWPGEDPIGKRIWTGALGRDGDWSRVIGVVEHQRHGNVNEDYNETIFFPEFRGWPGMQRYAAIRTSVEAASIALSIRATLRQLDPNATLARVRTMKELVGNALAPNRFALLLIAIFAGVAVILAAVGLYGVISYSVSQRTREIGIRIAFGAANSSIMRLVVGQGFALTGLGVVLGVVGAVGLTRVISSMLVGVAPTDPVTFTVVAAVLVAVGLLGSYVPARRALKVDPTEALRTE